MSKAEIDARTPIRWRDLHLLPAGRHEHHGRHEHPPAALQIAIQLDHEALRRFADEWRRLYPFQNPT